MSSVLGTLVSLASAVHPPRWASFCSNLPRASGLIDTQLPGDKIGSVSEDKTTGGISRYGAVVATFIGVCALFVSGYTAYMQRQQVRAAVWPILEFYSSNAPDINFTLANKGVGPAIIRHVILKVDDRPVKNWPGAMEILLGPGEHHGSESDMSGRVFAAGESATVFTPFDSGGKPFTSGRSDPEWNKMNDDRFRITVEICYCSTLGECWTLRAGGKTASSTTECRSCPGPSEISFQQ